MSEWCVVALQGVPALPPVDTGMNAVRATLALVAVTVALGVFMWLLKRGTFAFAAGRAGRQALAVESAISLGDRRSLVIVSVEGRRLLLGTSAASVTLVTELQPSASRAAGSGTGASAKTFGTALDSAMGPREGHQS